MAHGGRFDTAAIAASSTTAAAAVAVKVAAAVAVKVAAAEGDGAGFSATY